VHKLPQRRFQNPVDDVADEVLQPVQQLVERDEGALGLDVGVLGNVTARPRLSARYDWAMQKASPTAGMTVSR